ncbi:SDR family NAD(P)-dependent oxidoreductase [Microbacterium sp. SA39]|uniref:SDR family NAD(P)-dependent oxidoreductase n=1 Tax=Microbacterium sp. SA39 TaxID=1263625 RepID=UPI0005FA6972|nr:SDR family NAD(P)-dependent oxidoreductase [Microbacterium sp. SA39]KJQ54224.1 3-oxoacyl-[acyl-carrier-protein] reductase FabG [Microbacterium sp. SA39]
MARILVTGSTDGLGRATAESLLDQGHQVIVHARSAGRATAVADLADRGADLIIADLADRQAVMDAAAELDGGAAIEAVIHNAGVISGADLLPVNVVAPYLFTALLRTPTRHIYLSSGMHRGGSTDLDGLDWDGSRQTASYSDTKLFVTTLSAAIAERWAPRVSAHAVDPGWVPTKMGGAGAPDDFDLGHETQEYLATDPHLSITGGYWHHGEQRQPHPAVADPRFQERLLAALADATGVALP